VGNVRGGEGYEIFTACALSHIFRPPQLNAGEPGLSFSFACRDDTNGLTSLELTELAARVMQERFGLAPRNIVGLIENGKVP